MTWTRSRVSLSVFFFFSSRRRHTRLQGDWSSDVCSSDLDQRIPEGQLVKAMEIDRSQDQFSRHLDHVRLRVRRHMLLQRSEGPLLERTTTKWTVLCTPPGTSIGVSNAPRMGLRAHGSS